jgi:hypothetical protein
MSRWITFLWACALIGISLILKSTKNPLVEIGLSIASITYGGMLGIFLIGRFSSVKKDLPVLFGVLFSIAVNILIAVFTAVFWLWYVVIGVTVTVIVTLCIQKLQKI